MASRVLVTWVFIQEWVGTLWLWVTESIKYRSLCITVLLKAVFGKRMARLHTRDD